MDTSKRTIDDACPACGIGFILPSGRCDHCNMDFAPVVALLAPTPLTTALDARLGLVACGTAYREMREHAEEMERKLGAARIALRICRNALFIDDEHKHGYAIDDADAVLEEKL